MSQSVKTEILQDIQSGENLFSLPATLRDVLEVLSDERASIDLLASAIQRDPGLTATALRVANSPYYHRVSEVRTLPEAVRTLGDVAVKTIALTATILNPRHIADTSGIDPEQLVANSLNVATLARELALVTGMTRPEDALMGGLLTDLGMLYFMCRRGEQYREVVTACKDGAHLLEAERRVFGINHMEVGAELAQVWLLPADLVNCIRCHHSCSRGEKDVHELTRVVRLATLISADAHVSYTHDAQRDLLEELHLRKLLDIDDLTLRYLGERSQSELNELASRFGIQAGACEDLVRRANRKLGHMLMALEQSLAERDQLHSAKLAEEKRRAATEARLATVVNLAHHVNNATTVISARAELLGNRLNGLLGGEERSEMLAQLEQISASVERINTALKEMSTVQGLESLAEQTNDFVNMEIRTPQDAP